MWWGIIEVEGSGGGRGPFLYHQYGIWRKFLISLLCVQTVYLPVG